MAKYDLDRMHELLANGWSNKAIADELGVSIGTVAGRRYRAGKPHIPKQDKPPSAKPVSKVSHVLKIKLATREKKKHGPRNLDIFSLRKDYCRWPRDGGLYCAATVVNGYPYCHEHCLQAYPMYAAKYQGGYGDRR